MDVNDLKLFTRAAELGNITRAAAELGYTQSAASHALRRLEQSLGTQLLQRLHMGVCLTENGRALLPYAAAMLTAQERLIQKAGELSDRVSGTVSVGGADVWENVAVKQRIASIPDDWHYFMQSSIRDMMKFYRGFYPQFNMERYEKLYEEKSFGFQRLMKAFPDMKSRDNNETLEKFKIHFNIKKKDENKKDQAS